MARSRQVTWRRRGMGQMPWNACWAALPHPPAPPPRQAARRRPPALPVPRRQPSGPRGRARRCQAARARPHHPAPARSRRSWRASCSGSRPPWPPTRPAGRRCSSWPSTPPPASMLATKRAPRPASRRCGWRWPPRRPAPPRPGPARTQGLATPPPGLARPTRLLQAARPWPQAARRRPSRPCPSRAAHRTGTPMRPCCWAGRTGRQGWPGRRSRMRT